MLLSIFLIAACDVPYDVPREPPDAGARYGVPEAWRMVRTEMVKAKACFAERRPYCVTDRDVLDESIQVDLDTHFHGRMPLNERWLNELTGRARAAWNDSMKHEYRGRVSERVRANWNSPSRNKTAGRVDVDLFVPPGKLSLEKKAWRMESPLAHNGELVTPELASKLDRFREEYPNMPVVRLLIDVPIQDGIDFRRWDVRHLLESDRIVIVDPNDATQGAWVSPPLPAARFLPYMNGELSLRTNDLERCVLGPSMKAEPDCTKHPKYRRKTQKRKPKDRTQRPGWDPLDE